MKEGEKNVEGRVKKEGGTGVEKPEDERPNADEGRRIKKGRKDDKGR